MTRQRLLILLGALVAIAPFSGVPVSYLAWVLPLLGALTIAFSISLRKRTGVRSHESS